MRAAAIALALGLALASGGCLTNAYSIPRDEAARLAQLDPAVRGTSVRMTQQTSLEEPPSRAPPQTVVVYVPNAHLSVGARANPRAGGGDLALPRDGKAIAVIIIGAALIAGVALAATEGERFDGWARVGPMHPVHVTYPDGTQQWMPLAALDPATVQASSRIVLRDDEGPLQDLERAPLNRVGATYGIELGAGALLSPVAVRDVGFVSHIQIGGFPLQWLGILADAGFGIGRPFDVSVGVELQVLPVDLGPLHLGVYGRGGFGYAEEDVDTVSGPRGTFIAGASWGGGALVQLEISTRLAFVLRGGVVGIGEGTPTWEATAGMAVY